MPEGSFGDEYKRIRAGLAESGYEITKVKNTLGETGVRYRGVNTKVECADGYIFELQFHTETSLEVKEKSHELYEVVRLPETSSEEKEKLIDQIVEMSDAIPMPAGIEEVQ